MNKFLLVQLFTVLMLSSMVLARPLQNATWSEKLEYIQSFADQLYAPAPGYVMSIDYNNETFTLSNGFANNETQAPMTADTYFSIASVSKFVNAIILANLTMEGVIDMDQPMTNYCPTLKFSDSYMTEHATFRDAATHILGFGAYQGDAVWSYDNRYSGKEFLQMMNGLPVCNSFRDKPRYNNNGVSTTGFCAAEAANKTYEQLVIDIINSIGVQLYVKGEDAENAGYQVATSYDLANNAYNTTEQDHQWGMAGAIPAAGLWARMSDLARISRAFFNYEFFAEAGMALFKPSTFMDNSGSLQLTDCGAGGIGPGYWRVVCDVYECMTHGGNSAGITTMIAVFPSQKVGLVIAGNYRSLNVKLYGILIEAAATIIGIDRIQPKLPSELANTNKFDYDVVDVDYNLSEDLMADWNPVDTPSNAELTCDYSEFAPGWDYTYGNYTNAYYGTITVRASPVPSDAEDNALPIQILIGSTVNRVVACHSGTVTMYSEDEYVFRPYLARAALVRFVGGFDSIVSGITLVFRVSDLCTTAHFVKEGATPDPVPSAPSLISLNRFKAMDVDPANANIAYIVTVVALLCSLIVNIVICVRSR